MDARSIGSLEVSAVGLGCNNFGMRIDEERTASVVNAALDAGITFFDTADIYGGTKSEEFLGRALGGRRKDVVLATKFGMPLDDAHKGARPEYVASACADSLRRLGTEWIDLYWLHTPDPETPIADTLGALNQLVSAGKVRQIGCSNFSAGQLREAEAQAQRLGGARFVAVQNEYSLLHRQPEADGVLDACAALGTAFVPYFPLASGMLTGKYRPGKAAPEGSRLATSARAPRWLNDENLALVDRLGSYAARRQHSILELAFGWLLARPEVAGVIAGATSPAQVRANAAAAGWRLSPDEIGQVAALLPAAVAAD